MNITNEEIEGLKKLIKKSMAQRGASSVNSLASTNVGCTCCDGYCTANCGNSCYNACVAQSYGKTHF